MSVSDAEIDFIYDIIDDALLEGWWGFVDDLLMVASMRLHRMETDIILTLLTTTLPAKSKLSRRQDFYDCVETIFIERHPNEWRGLLVGLK